MSVLRTLCGQSTVDQRERAAWGAAYQDRDLVFCREDGSPHRPEKITKLFTQLSAEAGLRRVRLHDLRHAAASLMLAANVPLALASKRLGHSSASFTADTYSHLLEGVGRAAAEATAALIPRRPFADGGGSVARWPGIGGLRERQGTRIRRLTWGDARWAPRESNP